MKITIVLGAFFPVPPIKGGAVEKIWFELGQEFVRRGHEVVQISRSMPELPREQTLEGVRHLRVSGFDAPRSLIWLKMLDLVYSLRAMSILPKSDVIVTNTFWLPMFLRNAYVHVARYPKGQTRFYKCAVRLQAPSQSVAGAIAAEAPALAEKVRVVPYPAPGSTDASEPGPTTDRAKIILYVGRVHPEKGVHLLVEAFARGARTVFAEWKLMIVGPTETTLGGGGDVYLASLKSLASNTSVEFTGAIFDQGELETKYRSARLFVYPSLADSGESFGLAPLEAMTQRCAVVVSDLACFRDFISDRQTGLVFDHRSANPRDALGRTLEAAMVEPSPISRLADAGYHKSKEYSLESVAGQFIADFESITPARHA